MAGSFDVVFHGNSESECFNFIRAVRQYAKENGKIRDNAWIADELYNAFDGKALKWYTRLAEDVQGDWGRLQEALLTRWTTDDDDDDISAKDSSIPTLPTPAGAPAASPPDPTPSGSSLQYDWTGKVGRVRIQANGRADVRYLSKDCPSGAFVAAANPSLALAVRLVTTTSNFYRVEIVEHESGLSVLAAYCPRGNDWNVSAWGGLIGVDAPGQGLLSGRRTTLHAGLMDHQYWTEKWRMESTGVLKLCGPGDTAEIARFNVGVKPATLDILRLGSPGLAIGKRYVQADLKFEPLGN